MLAEMIYNGRSLGVCDMRPTTPFPILVLLVFHDVAALAWQHASLHFKSCLTDLLSALCLS